MDVRAPGPAPVGPIRLPVRVGPRPTCWIVWGPALPRHDDALTELDRALAAAGVERRAIRWDPEA